MMRILLLVLVLVLLALPGLHAAARPVHDLGSGTQASHRLSFARVPWAGGPAAIVAFLGSSDRPSLSSIVTRLPLIAPSLFVPPEA